MAGNDYSWHSIMTIEIEGLPPLFVQFVVATLFSFLVGLEYHSYRRAGSRDLGFGTTRTFTLLGIFGFVLYALAPNGMLFRVGLGVLGVFLLVLYWSRLQRQEESLLGLLLALLVFLIGPVTQTFPSWFLVLYVVLIIVMLGEKPGIRKFSDAFRSNEAVTIAKFLIMVGLILPLLPSRQIAPFLSITYVQVWLAVVVVSGISYLSYLAQTYFFPQRGPLLTGLLGGLYSSTATSVVLSRRVREEQSIRAVVSPALILATAMMYLRLWVLILMLGHLDVAQRLALPFGVFLIVSLGIAYIGFRRSQQAEQSREAEPVRLPLELSTAVLFALLFVLFAGVIQYVIEHFGSQGLEPLSFLSGLTDIDPFILSLVAGRFPVDTTALVSATLIASGSNNLLKAAYSWGLARDRAVLGAVAWLVLLCVVSLIWAYGLGQ